ncbi:MAG: twitching motility protein PilT [Bradymonadia bacterium]|jgi:twitching motility protein PilT
MALELNRVLQVALKGGASDIHIKAGLPPMFRVNGSLVPLKDAERLTPEEIARTAHGMMSQAQILEFKERHDCDFAYGVPGVGRFRVNVFQQRNAVGMVLRVIPYKVRTIDQLGLPDVVKAIADNRRGLILVAGTTGSGKSTTLASIIEHINATRSEHIITIEDPIEFLIRDKRSVINQREVGTDCESFQRALRAALRQDPDVILIGEMRDKETVEIGLTAAETGHLVLATLHTTDCTETITRLISVFPPHQQKHVRLMVSSLLTGVIAQRLVPTKTGGRVPAIEAMVTTARVRELILDENRFREIREAIEAGRDTYGMQSFDQGLMDLLNRGLISYEEAVLQSSNPDDFALKVSGIGGTGNDDWKPYREARESDAVPTFDFDDF